MTDDEDRATDGAGARQGAHVVVVGAGVAGLTTARHLLRELPLARVTVLESSPRTGGKLRLGEIAGQQVDLGAEAMLNRRPEAVGLAREVGLGDAIVYAATTSAGVWSRGAVRPLPRTIMGVPTDLAAVADSGITSRRGVHRARLERAMRTADVTRDVGVGMLVSRRIGPEMRDRLVEPLLGGVYAGRADELSLHATVPQLVPAIAEHGSLLAAAAAVAAASAAKAGGVDGEPEPVFAGIDGGVGRLTVALEEALLRAGGVVRCNTTVRDITRVGSGFRLVVGPAIAPEVLAADAVVVAAPAAPAARMLRSMSPVAAAELGGIEYASMAVVTLAYPASAGAAADLVGSGFLVPPVDGHQVKAATYSSRKWGWLGDDLLVVRCSIGRYGDERQLHRDDGELVRLAAAELEEAVGLRGPVIDGVVTRWGGALPQYAVGHLDRVRRIEDAVAAVPGLEVCGAAYDGLGIPACIASADAAATRVVEGLAAGERMVP